MERIAIFGACREGIEAYRVLKASSMFDPKPKEFIFIDNDSRLENSLLEGLPIYKPEMLDFTFIDKVIIAVIVIDRVKTQLMSLGIPENKILSFYSNVYFSEKIRKQGLALIGKYSYFKPSTVLYNVEIGNFCHIGADCRLGLIGHAVNNPTTYPMGYHFGTDKESLDVSNDYTIDKRKIKPLIIGHDVYIGEGVTIMAGLKVGNSAVIASKSVVTKDVPDFAVVAGIPAKVVSYRVSDQQREILMESKWWDYNEKYASEILTKIHTNLF